jgi:hypothetical protein
MIVEKVFNSTFLYVVTLKIIQDNFLILVLMVRIDGEKRRFSKFCSSTGALIEHQ